MIFVCKCCSVQSSVLVLIVIMLIVFPWICVTAILNVALLQPPLSLEHFTCKICGNTLDQPVKLSCSHTFCDDRLVLQVQYGNCQRHMTSCKVGGIKKLSDLLVVSLNALPYERTSGTTTVPLQSLHTDLSFWARAPASIPNAHIPSHITLWQVLNTTTNSTPSTAECRVLGHLTQRMMTLSHVYSTDSTITVPTGGQVYCRNTTTIITTTQSLQ